MALAAFAAAGIARSEPMGTGITAFRLSMGKALVPFVTAGDPSLAATVPVMHALVEAGADVIELGVPFSDPMADGPVIQRSSERALARGAGIRYVGGFWSSNDNVYQNPAQFPVDAALYYAKDNWSLQLNGKNVFGLSGRGIKTHLIVNAKSGQLADTDFALADKAAQVCPVGVILKKRQGFAVPIGERKYDKAPISETAESTEGR